MAQPEPQAATVATDGPSGAANYPWAIRQLALGTSANTQLALRSSAIYRWESQPASSVLCHSDVTRVRW